MKTLLLVCTLPKKYSLPFVKGTLEIHPLGKNFPQWIFTAGVIIYLFFQWFLISPRFDFAVNVPSLHSCFSVCQKCINLLSLTQDCHTIIIGVFFLNAYILLLPFHVWPTVVQYYSSIGSFWALFSFCSKTIIHFFFLAVSGNPDAPHITAIEGDKITLNCDVNFPNGANSPYVVQWWRKVRKLQKIYDLDL